MRGGTQVSALIALCLAVMLSQGGCGDEKPESRTPPAAQEAPQPRVEAPAAKGDAPEPSRPEVPDSERPKPSAPQQPGQGQAERSGKKGATRADQGSKSSRQNSDGKAPDEPAPADSQPPADLTDEEACERDPTSCRSAQPAVDPANPDSRRAQGQDGADAGVPPDCHTNDCERARAAEG